MPGHTMHMSVEIVYSNSTFIYYQLQKGRQIYLQKSTSETSCIAELVKETHRLKHYRICSWLYIINGKTAQTRVSVQLAFNVHIQSKLL